MSNVHETFFNIHILEYSCISIWESVFFFWMSVVSFNTSVCFCNLFH